MICASSRLVASSLSTRSAACIDASIYATSVVEYAAWAARRLDAGIEVLHVIQRKDAVADARSFIDVHEPLPLYSDMKFQLPFELPGEGKMPQTVILDRQGRIRASFSGEADWASPEARALIDALLAEPVS